MALVDDINSNQIILVIIKKNDYISRSSDVLTNLDKTNLKTCYVSLNKPYRSIITNMEKHMVKPDNFIFIDVLTATVETPPQIPNCIFVESPNAITDLSLSFSKAMFEMGCENSVFDTISTLLIYEDQASVIRLSQNLMTKIRVGGKKAVFIALKEDSEQLAKDLMMFVDDVIEL